MIGVPIKRVLAGLPGYCALPPLSARGAGMGLAVLASAVAAMTICALLPDEPARFLPPSAVQQAGQTLVAATAAATAATAPQVAPQAGVAMDVAKVWAAERARIFATNNPAMRGTWSNVWSPAGGVAILFGGRLPSVARTVSATANPPATANQRTAEAKTAVPLPPHEPAVHAYVGKHHGVARSKPLQLEPKVASLPPQAPEPGYLDFFRKLFGHPTDDAAKAIMAANPKTAIYDIAKHVVFLPNGERLEAHSGYGQWMDDPNSVSRKDLGVTPPNLYAVSFRQKLFHGVRALRLTPVGDGKMYGRDGMLAHSYMLGDSGQSNGCVSVKEYQKFLQAYKDGDFDQLIVVRSIDHSEPTPARVASAQPGSV